MSIILTFNSNATFANTSKDVVTEETSNIIGSGSSSISASSNTSSNNLFRICDNINLFENSSRGNYNLIDIKTSNLNSYKIVSGYGVAQIYQSKSDLNLFDIKMKSNIRGNK